MTSPIVVRVVAWSVVLGVVGLYLVNGLTADDPTPPGPWMGELFTLLVVTVIVVPMLASLLGEGLLPSSGGRNSSRFRDAPIGVGTVLSATPTGTVINDQPQLRIDMTVVGQDGMTFESHAKQVVPVTELALVVPGTVLPVRYRPGATERVELVKGGRTPEDVARLEAQIQAAYDEVMIRQGLTTPRRIEISRTGVAARAVVRELHVTGEMRDGRPRLLLDLVVTRPDGTTFEARVDRFVPGNVLPKLQAGNVVDVHYLPGHEDEVVFAIPANPNIAGPGSRRRQP
ncbi:hypothetical protein ACTWP5_28520 [Streptomyces sp. 4N509B]|uniref:hypothetical protein n=1 Tax=Streptomyces sp. 4N509B TaxID=3457413 RepID=UPI003FD4B914